MDSSYAGPILVVALAAVCYGIERLRDHYGKPPSPPLPPTEAELQRAIDEVAKAALAELKESIGDGKTAHLKASFVLLRARRLVEQDPTLRDPSRAAAWKASVISSFRHVEQYLVRKLGTSSARGPLFGGATDLQPPHLDLAKFAMSRMSDVTRGFDFTTDADAVAAASPTKSQQFALRELDRRRARVWDIVWRAAGIESGVWNPDGTLRDADLTELLDRRLRSIERLAYEASAGAGHFGKGSSNIVRIFFPPPSTATDKLGPIADESLVRMFEAPSVPERAVPGLITATNSVDSPRFQFGSRVWYRNRLTQEFDLDVWPGTRPGDRGFVGLDKPPQATPSWTLAPDEAGERRGYAWILTPPGDRGPAQVIEDLFARAPREWFERSLLHPDGVFSALHIEALRHALLRRDGTDVRFDALLDRYDFVLGDAFDLLKHARVPRSILAPGVTDHFQNDGVPMNELQVGDQVVLDRHPVYFGMWDHEYPTAMVTSIDPRPDGTVSLERIRVQGFDTADLKVGAFMVVQAWEMEVLLKEIRTYVEQNQLRLRAEGRLTWQAGEVHPFLRADRPSGVNNEKILVEWPLFIEEMFDPPGAVWIQILPQSRIWRGLVPADPRDAVSLIPKSVTVLRQGQALFVNDGKGGTFEVALDPIASLTYFFVRPEQIEHPAVYVPLYEPEGGWSEYYVQKLRNPARRWPSRLLPVSSDVWWIPGIAFDAQSRVRVVRPRLKPPGA